MRIRNQTTPTGLRLIPQITFIPFLTVFAQQRTQFLLKGHLAMMFVLSEIEVHRFTKLLTGEKRAPIFGPKDEVEMNNRQ